MHNHKSELQFGKESLCLSSDSDSNSSSTPPSLFFSPNAQIQTQLDRQTQNNTNIAPNQTHFSIQVPPFSFPSHYSPNPPVPAQENLTRNLCHHERISISNNPSPSPSASQTPLSSPHKRPTMSHTSSPRHNQRPSVHTESSLPSLSCCCASFADPFGTKFRTFNLFTRLRCFRLLPFHFHFIIFISLPSLYFFLSNYRSSFFLGYFSVIAFSAAFLISLSLALPRLPSIRLLFARSLPIKLSSSFPAASSPQPVLWSIGSNPKHVKSANSGFWVQVYSNGDVYEGEFHNGKCSGSGVYHYHLSGRYEGDWVYGKYDGYGVETWARGSRYRGQYRQGLRHGLGIYRFYSGDVYAGEWSNGQCHGFGVHTCNDGSRYIGEFKWGVKHGHGQYQFRNGDVYAGEYFADKVHGFGVYHFQNGHRYEGAWHEGRRQGLGMYTFRNGETQCGHWQNGILNDPKMANSHTGSPCDVDHAKVVKAVQDAHCAADKAYNVAKVDERVNKVVAAANKAANAARVAAVKAVQNKMHHNSNDK